jgi:hypothetical protein
VANELGQENSSGDAAAIGLAENANRDTNSSRHSSNVLMTEPDCLNPNQVCWAEQASLRPVPALPAAAKDRSRRLAHRSQNSSLLFIDCSPSHGRHPSRLHHRRLGKGVEQPISELLSAAAGKRSQEDCPRIANSTPRRDRRIRGPRQHFSPNLTAHVGWT